MFYAPRNEMELACKQWLMARDQFRRRVGSKTLDEFWDAEHRLFAAFAKDWRGTDGRVLGGAYDQFRQLLAKRHDDRERKTRCLIAILPSVPGAHYRQWTVVANTPTKGASCNALNVAAAEYASLAGVGTIWVLRLYAHADLPEAMQVVQRNGKVRLLCGSGKDHIPLWQSRLLAAHLCAGVAKSSQSYLCGRTHWRAMALSFHP
jgi:hypothetical protein